MEELLSIYLQQQKRQESSGEQTAHKGDKDPVKHSDEQYIIMWFLRFFQNLPHIIRGIYSIFTSVGCMLGKNKDLNLGVVSVQGVTPLL